MSPLPKFLRFTYTAKFNENQSPSLLLSCRARTRTSGYRARKATVGGRKVLAARQKRGRKVLCPAHSNTGKGSASSNKKSTNKAYRVNRDRARFYAQARGYSKLAKGEKY
jgi:large subunit ribosomal protein L34